MSSFWSATLMFFIACFDVSFVDLTESSMIDRPWLLGPRIFQVAAAFGYKTKFVPPSLLKLSSFPNFQLKYSSQFFCLRVVHLR
jgi:hypothetical protein